MGRALTIEDQIVAAVRRIIRAVDLHSRRLVRDIGLTGPQLATLRAVESLGESHIGAVARAIHLSQPTLTGIIQRLERAAYIQRLPHEQDGRSVNITITPAGKELLCAASDGNGVFGRGW